MSTLIPNMMEMPIEKRLQCMEELWDSMRNEDLKSPEWHKEVLAARKREIEEGTARVISGGELKRRLQKGK